MLPPQELHPQLQPQLQPHELQLFESATDKIKSSNIRKFEFVFNSVSLSFAKIEIIKTNKRLLVLFINSPLVFFFLTLKNKLF